jgi:hypothetical protein
MKRTPLRHHRPEPVPYSERAAVYARDKVCFLYRLDSDHICRDPWGNPHAPDDLVKLTLDHVKDSLMLGRKAPNDRLHLVAMCWRGNVDVPSKAIREAERSYLATFREAVA